MRRRSWFEATKNSPTSYRLFGMALSHQRRGRALVWIKFPVVSGVIRFSLVDHFRFSLSFS